MGTPNGHDLAPILTIEAADVPPQLSEWIGSDRPALLVSIERLDDGRLVLQALPDADPTLVARIRKILAEHADVLRRLT